MPVKKILLIRTCGLGDTILMWPAVNAVRKSVPRARIDIMGHRDRCELLAGQGGADQALEVEGSGLHYLFQMGSEPPPGVRRRFGSYDLIVVFAAPGDYALAENLSACGAREVHAFLPFPPEGERTHAADHLLDCLVGVGLAERGATVLLPISEQEKKAGRERLREIGIADGRTVILAPGSGSLEKNWSPKRFAQLADGLSKLDLQPVLMEGPADRDAVASVKDRLENQIPLLAGDSPAGLKGVLARAALFVGNDSGPTHLAAALGVPSVAVFGPTDPEVYKPRGPRVAIVRREVDCSPCTEDERHACNDRICLDAVRIEDVMRACREMLA